MTLKYGPRKNYTLNALTWTQPGGRDNYLDFVLSTLMRSYLNLLALDIAREDHQLCPCNSNIHKLTIVLLCFCVY